MGARNCRLFTMFFVFLRLWANGQDVSECPLKMEPSTVVVRYGDPVSVDCTVSGDHDGIGWEASEGSVSMVPDVKFLTWSLESLTYWDIRPKCYAIFQTGPESGFYCHEELNITVYKPSDSVSISAVNHTGPMLEGEEYQLQCEVQNIAPVQYLTVKWYKGETLENQASYDALTKTPVNVSPTLLITPSRADDGAQYNCVAVLELGPEGPQPPPSNKSDPINITVNFDYLPLIAGIVALAVVCISIAFVFIYLICCKIIKMGEYNLKMGKSRTQNAHVAQNGKDSSLPMKKLTKPSLPV